MAHICPRGRDFNLAYESVVVTISFPVPAARDKEVREVSYHGTMGKELGFYTYIQAGRPGGLVVALECY